MSYFFSKTIAGISIDEAKERLSAELLKEGFGIVSEIDVTDTLKEKIDVDYKNYLIIGACNPHFAHKALQLDDKVGLFLPCNIVIMEHSGGMTEVAAIDPIISMAAVENENLRDFASLVRKGISSVIENLE